MIAATGGAGVELDAGGGVNNAGSISGSVGIFVTNGTGTVANSGSISGSGTFGVDLAGAGSLTNDASASISGKPRGLPYTAGSGTITNSGTITGGTDAIILGGIGANRLVRQFDRCIQGNLFATSNATSNVLEFAGGTGSLSGLSGGWGTATENGTWSFENFGTLALDAGASWSVTGSNTLASLVNDGSLTVASGGALNVTNAFVVDPGNTGLFTICADSVLDFGADVGSGVQVSFQSLGRYS